MRADSFADRLLLVLGRRAPAYRWTVAPGGFWATVAASTGRTLDGALPPRSEPEPAGIEQASARVLSRPLRPASPGRSLRPLQPIPVPSPWSPPRRRRAAIWDLAPRWIGVVTALVITLAGAGFIAGRASESNNSVAPGTSPSVGTTLPDTRQPGTGAASASPGTLLGSYLMTVPAGYSVPVDETAPVANQYSTTGAGDVAVRRSSGAVNLVPLNDSLMVVLPPDGNSPSYRSCTVSTNFAFSVTATRGTSSCLVKPGLVAGLTVVSVTDTQISLRVLVWRH